MTRLLLSAIAALLLAGGAQAQTVSQSSSLPLSGGTVSGPVIATAHGIVSGTTVDSPTGPGSNTNTFFNCCAAGVTGTQVGTSAYAPLSFGFNWALNALSASSVDSGWSTSVNLRPGFAGKFTVMSNNLAVQAAPLVADNTNHQYGVSANYGTATVNVGGTDQSPADNLGFLEGFNCNLLLQSGATNWNSVTSCEVDTEVDAGATVGYKTGLLSVLGDPALNRGIYGDYGILFNASTTSGSWKDLIAIGGNSTIAPTASDSTGIHFIRKIIPSLSSAPLMDTGIDGQEFTYTSFEDRFPNSARDSTGQLYANGLVTTGNIKAQAATLTGITINAFGGVTGGAYFASASLPTLTIQAPPSGGTQAVATVAHMQLTKALYVSGQSGYANGDVLTLTGGTGTQATVTLSIASFTGSISHATLTTSAETGAAIAAGMVVEGGTATACQIVSGSSHTWTLGCDEGTVASASMTGTAVAITSAGSYTATSATPGVTGGSGSGGTFRFGYGIVDFTISNAGALYAASPPPKIWPSASSNSRNIPASLTATMTATQATLSVVSPLKLAPASYTTASAIGITGASLIASNATYTDGASSGTTAVVGVNAFGSPTVNASSASTFTNLATLYVPIALATGNVTCTTCESIYATGQIKTTSSLSSAGLFAGSATIQLNNNGGSNTTQIGDGTTSGQVSIGGASNTVLFAGASVKATGITTGTNADTVCLKADGTFLIQAAACTISSLRFKMNVRPYDLPALPTIGQMSVDTFRMKPAEKPNPDPNYRAKQIGLIAENIAKVAPDCALYEDDMKTPKSYRQECVIALLVKGEQELIAQNAHLAQRVARLERRAHHH